MRRLVQSEQVRASRSSGRGVHAGGGVRPGHPSYFPVVSCLRGVELQVSCVGLRGRIVTDERLDETRIVPLMDRSITEGNHSAVFTVTHPAPPFGGTRSGIR